MGDTYTGECKRCHVETDLINGICEDCALRLTMQEIGLENEVHLCNSCCNVYPDCEAKNVIFGTGVGTDNIAACNSYEAITFRHPKDKGRI